MKKNAINAIYPGSFDPLTNGHLDVIKRASYLFNELTVAVASENNKNSLFTVAERLDIIRDSIKDYENISVKTFNGLLVNFCKDIKASTIVRGLRAISDFEYEFQMALMNRKINDEIITVFLMPKEDYTYISSRIVKEISKLNGDITAFCPKPAQLALRNKHRKS